MVSILVCPCNLHQKLIILDFSTAQDKALCGPRCPHAHLCLRTGRKEAVGGSTQGMSTEHLSASRPTQNNRMRESKAESSPLELSSSWASHHTLLQLWKGKTCQELFQLCSGEKFQLFLGQSASQESAQVLLYSNIQTPGFSAQRQMTKYIRII